MTALTLVADLLVRGVLAVLVAVAQPGQGDALAAVAAAAPLLRVASAAGCVEVKWSVPVQCVPL